MSTQIRASAWPPRSPGTNGPSGRIRCQAATKTSTRRTSWCSLDRTRQAREKRGARIATIDVRGTATTESADLALTIKPGMDGVLFSGLLIHLADGGFIDHAFAGAHTEGFEAALAAARRIAPDLATVAKKCGAGSTDIAALFDLWATTDRVATLY